MTKKLLLTLAGVLGCALALSGQVTLLSTDFSGSTGNVSLPYVDANDATNNGNRAVTRNQFTWTQSDPTVLSLAALDTLTMGAFSWGSSGTPLTAGRIFTSLAGGQNNTGTGGAGTTSTIRSTGTTDETRARLQFNSSSVGGSGTAPADVAVWNLLFQVGTGGIAGLDFSFRAGTAQTSGSWDNNSIANNGNYNIRITPVSITGSTGIAQFGSSVTVFETAAAIGAGAGPTLTSSYSNSIAAGVYLLQLEFSGQGTQRNSIGDFSMAVIPEPSTYAALLGGLALGFVAYRRRRR